MKATNDVILVSLLLIINILTMVIESLVVDFELQRLCKGSQNCVWFCEYFNLLIANFAVI